MNMNMNMNTRSNIDDMTQTTMNTSGITASNTDTNINTSYTAMNALHAPPLSHNSASASASIPAAVQDLFTQSKTEALLQRIIHAIEKNDRELSSLRCEMESSRIQMNGLKDLLTGIQYHQDVSVQRLDQVEQAIQVQIGGRIGGTTTSAGGNTSSTRSINNTKDNHHRHQNQTGSAAMIHVPVPVPVQVSMTVGQSVLANRKTLVRTLNLLSQKADTEEIKEMTKAQDHKLQTTISQLHHQFISNDVFAKVNEAINALNSRVEVLGDDVRNKIDKSLYKAFTSEAASLHNYAEFVKTTAATLKGVEGTFRGVNRDLEKCNGRMDSLSDQTENLVLEVTNNRPSKYDLEQVMKGVQSCSQSIQKKIETDEGLMHDLCRENKMVEDQIGVCQEDTKTLFASHETLAKYLTKRIDGIYTKKQVDKLVKKYVETDELETEKQGIEGKINQETNELRQALESFQLEMKVTKKKADLAAQFIALYNKD